MCCGFLFALTTRVKIVAEIFTTTAFQKLSEANAPLPIALYQTSTLTQTFELVFLCNWWCGDFEFQSQRREHFVPYPIHPVLLVSIPYGLPSIRLGQILIAFEADPCATAAFPNPLTQVSSSESNLFHARPSGG
jgi:hypothetical protein